MPVGSSLVRFFFSAGHDDGWDDKFSAITATIESQGGTLLAASKWAAVKTLVYENLREGLGPRTLLGQFPESYPPAHGT